MAYQFPLNGGRINASIGGNSTSAGAGYSLVSTGTLHLMGGNNVTLSQNANSITISGANIPNQTAYSFSNSNGVSFGTDGSTVTATVATNYAASNHSHGNPTLNLTNISGTTASASNGLTLSLSAAAQTAQTANFYVSNNSTQLSSTAGMDLRSFTFQGDGGISAGVSQGKILISAPEQSSLSHTGAVSISRNGNTISIGAPVQSVQTQNMVSVQGSTGAISFANGNGITFGGNNSTLTASHNGLTSQSNQAVSGSNGSVTFQTLSFTNANGISFYTSNNSAIMASYTVPNVPAQTAQTIGIYATGANTTGQSSSNTLDARSFSISAQGGLYAGMSGNTLQLSAATTYAASNHSHGNPTLNLTNISGTTASASNGLTLSLSAAPQTNQTIGISATSNTFSSSNGTVDARSLYLRGVGNASVGISNGSILISGGGGGGGIALRDGANSITSGTASISAGGALTASVNGQTLSLNAPAQSQLSATGAVSISNNGATISIGVPVQTNQTMGFSAGSNTTLTSTGTFDARSMWINGHGGVSAGFSNSSLVISAHSTYAPSNHSHGNPTLNLTNLSGTTASASNGLTLSLSAAAQSAQTQSNIQGVIASGSTNRTGDISFANSNNITFGLSNNTITASFAGGGGGIALRDAANSITSGTASISGVNLTASVNGQTLSLSVPATSSLSATGALSISVNANTVSIGVPAFSAGVSNLSNDSGNTGMITNRLVLAGGNNITLSQSTNANGATMSIIGGAGGGGGGIAVSASNSVFTSGTVKFTNAGGALTIGTAAQEVNFSVPAQSVLSAVNPLTLSSNGSTISIMMSQTTYNSTVFGARNNGMLGTASLGQNTVFIYPEKLDEYVSGSVIKIPVNITNSSSGFAAHTRGYTAQFGIYSRHATNSTVLTRMYSTSYTAAVSANSNGTWAASLITGVGNSTSYNTLTASSAGLNLSASIHGARELIMPFATVLPPGDYWFGFVNSSSSAGASGNLFNASFIVNSTVTGNQFGVSQGTQSNGIHRNIGMGAYSATSGAMPAGISMTQINQTNIHPRIFFLDVTA